MRRDRARALLEQHRLALNAHDIGTLASLYADDATLVSPMFETVRGKADIIRSYERLFTIFPDYTVTVRDALFITEGDRAAQFGSVTATQRVELFGLPPTGHRIEYHAARLFTFQDGLIGYEQRIYDLGGVLERLEKSRLDRELTMASVVQQRLMARRQRSHPAFEITGSSLPCRAIGGDFLEYVDTPDGSTWIALGDVAGKGPAAALVAAMLQGMFAMVAAELDSPEAVLARLNGALYRRGIAPGYATLFCGRLGTDGSLRYANAGHAPPLFIAGNDTRALGAGGPILGVFDGASFPSESITLPEQAIVLVYSDGLTEAARSDGQDFGADRLVDAVRAAGSQPLGSVVESVMNAVREFCGTETLVDDATVVAVRRR